MMEALKSLISRYSFEYDDREPEYSFTTPFVGSFELINLDLSFWVVCFIFLTIQSIINAGVASVVFKFIVQQQGKIHTYIIGYGLVCPILLCGPLYLFSAFHFTNVTFMLCLCGAVPNLLLLRVIEAMHGMLPSFAKESAGMFALYYSATLQVKIDNKTNRPVPFTRKIFISKVLKFLSVFLQTSVLYSVLMPVGYSVAPHRPIHSLLDLYHWGNILNAFSMASLTSLVLDGGASGLGLLTSILSGLTMESFSDAPLTQSSSPSDFWGNRWDRPVASALRRGCFRPLRQAGFSRHSAAIFTFLTSGIIHEYILLVMAQRKGTPNNPQQEPYRPALGNHFVFFVWNAIVLLLERLAEGSTAIKWMQCHVPKQVRTALVLLTVLPIGHLFTDEYVKSCFFNDAAFAFPLVTYIGKHA